MRTVNRISNPKPQNYQQRTATLTHSTFTNLVVECGIEWGSVAGVVPELSPRLHLLDSSSSDALAFSDAQSRRASVRLGATRSESRYNMHPFRSHVGA